VENETPAPFERSSSGAQLLIFLGLTGMSIFLLFVVMMLLQMTGKVNLLLLQSPNAFSNPEVIQVLKFLQIISSVIIFILPVAVLAFLVSRRRIEYLQINRIGKISILLLGGIVMFVAAPLINYLQEINSYLQLPQWMHGIEEWMKASEAQDDALTAAFLNHQTFYDLILNLIMIALVAAVAEELFFRGVLQKILIKMTKNVHVGIWLTGAIFSAIHLQFYGFLPRMLMGVYLGYLLVWSGSLWVTIFAHFINNGTAVIFSYLEERKTITDSVEKVGTQAGDYWYIITSTLLVTLLLIAIYKLSGRKNEVVSEEFVP